MKNLRKKQEKGITLIALVITIIIMLILVTITISISSSGGLFNYAGNAVRETQKVKDEEENVTQGIIKVNEIWYNSIDEYFNNKLFRNLPEGFKVGDYVNYTPTEGTYTVAANSAGSGHSLNQTFVTETGNSALQWRVLEINEATGEIELVSDTVAQKLSLQGADGYNHAVDILNDLCETLYSKTVDGKKIAIARSINVEDINAKTTYNPKTDINYSSNYGKEHKYSAYNSSYRKYPNLYTQEDGFYIGGKEQEGGISVSVGVEKGVEKDGITSYSRVTGFTDDWDSEISSIKKDVSVTYTYYYYIVENYLNSNLGINTAPLDLIKLKTSYWLASRCINAGSANASFDMRHMGSGGAVSCYKLFSSGGDPSPRELPVRPVVTLGANVHFTPATEKINDTTTWDIQY